MPPVNFTAAQVVAIAVALASMPPGSPFQLDGRTVERKLRDALGEIEHVATHELARRVWVDRSRDPDQATTSSRVLRAVEQGLVNQRAISLAYRSGEGTLTRRVVEPIVVAWTEDHWYLVGYCRLREDIRWFRLSRIEQAAITNQRFQAHPVDVIGKPPPHASDVDTSSP